MTTTQQWITGLTGEDLTTWANRGLLRRAYKVLPETRTRVQDETILAEVTQNESIYTVTIANASFAGIRCSCAAVGPCHHVLAALLAVQATLPQAQPDTTPNRPWLIEDEAGRERQLGRQELRQAIEKLKRGLPVSLQHEPTALVGVVTDAREFRVRVPVSGGLAASLCECGKSRCTHRAAVVLSALNEAGICRLHELPDPPLSTQERLVLDEAQNWLNGLLRVGLEQFSSALLENGQTLAIRARQNDFPRLSGHIAHLTDLLLQELNGQVAVRVADVRERLMDIAILLRALNTAPLPRPRHELVGVHRREFFAVQDRVLNCVGVQAWHSARGMNGLSLHFCDVRQKQWYHYSVARPKTAQPALSPHETLTTERLGGQLLARLIDRKIHLKQGWLSADGSLSGREDTILELDGDAEIEIITDWHALRIRLAQAIEQTPLDKTPRLPAVIAPTFSDAARFDPVEQCWQQIVHDKRQSPQSLKLHQASPSLAWLQHMSQGVQPHERVFGLLDLHNEELCLQPLSLQRANVSSTLHLSLGNSA